MQVLVEVDEVTGVQEYPAGTVDDAGVDDQLLGRIDQGDEGPVMSKGCDFHVGMVAWSCCGVNGVGPGWGVG